MESAPAPDEAWFASRWKRLNGPARIGGVDLARGLAVLGMFAAHLLWITEPFDVLEPDTWIAVVSGRSSILFATLAGVSNRIEERPDTTAIHVSGSSTSNGSVIESRCAANMPSTASPRARSTPPRRVGPLSRSQRDASQLTDQAPSCAQCWRRSQTSRAFWAWSRFSASSHTTLCGPSITSASTS